MTHTFEITPNITEQVHLLAHNKANGCKHASHDWTQWSYEIAFSAVSDVYGEDFVDGDIQEALDYQMDIHDLLDNLYDEALKLKGDRDDR